MVLTSAQLAQLEAARTPKLLFNPDAPPEAGGGPARMVLTDEQMRRTYGAGFDKTPEAPGLVESTVRGGAQGLTGGWADEITGALESAFTNKTYVQARDESRKNYKAAEDANPIAYKAGEVGGGLASILVPGMGAAKGASLAANVGKAALQGAASGLGYSEADLTKGEIGQAAADTAVGAGVSAGLAGILGGVGRNLTKNAEDRASREILEEVSHGSLGRKDKKLLVKGAEGIKDAVFSDPEMAKKLGSAKKALPVVSDRLDDLGEQIGKGYEEIAHATGGGFRYNDILDGLNALKEEASLQPGSKAVRGVYEDLIKNVEDTWGKTIQKAHIPNIEAAAADEAAEAAAIRAMDDARISPRDMRRFVTELQGATANSLGSLHETTQFKINDEISSGVKGVLDSLLDKAVAENPQLRASVDGIRELNKRYASYANIKRALSSRLTKEETNTRGMGKLLDEAAGKAGMVQAGIAAAATGNPMALGIPLAAKAVNTAADLGWRRGNIALAKAVRAARAGEPEGALVKSLVEDGAPHATAVTIARQLSAQFGRRN